MAVANIANRIDTVKGSFAVSRTILADGEVAKDPLLAVAKVGALTTRTSDSVGTLTMVTGHAIVAANRLDLYWIKPDGTRGYRYGIVVGAVAVDAVPITGGDGDILPLDETVITAMVPNLETFPVLFAAMQALAIGCEAPAQFVFIDAAAAVVLAVTVDNNLDSYIWDLASGIANPFAANVANVYMSHGSADSSFRTLALALVN